LFVRSKNIIRCPECQQKSVACGLDRHNRNGTVIEDV
jgi:hypothetical protein